MTKREIMVRLAEAHIGSRAIPLNIYDVQYVENIADEIIKRTPESDALPQKYTVKGEISPYDVSRWLPNDPDTVVKVPDPDSYMADSVPPTQPILHRKQELEKVLEEMQEYIEVRIPEAFENALFTFIQRIRDNIFVEKGDNA